MAVNVVGIVSLIVFYLIILAVGMYASRKLKKKNKGVCSKDEDAMLAGRSIGLVVGIFCLTATWVDGALINGSAEEIFTHGILWCQAPFGYALSLMLGSFFFAKPMREKEYVTMLDPLQANYGKRMGGLLYLPAFCGEMFWTAAILSALGTTISVMLDFNPTISIVISGVVAVLYTVAGGMYSVSYTDVIDVVFILFGLWLCVPFILTNQAVKNYGHSDWVGHIELKDTVIYVENFLQICLGGIPWQVYFQRVLACKSAYQAQVLSFIAAFGVVFMAIPAFVIGIACKSTAWNETSYGQDVPADKADIVLPLALQHLTPPAAAFFGLGAVSAAVMSSCDASILSAGSMFSRNIYKLIFRQKAGETEILWVLRFAMISVGAIATGMAITVKSVYSLYVLCSDFVYVLLFPQLVTVIYLPQYSNTYGSLSGYVISLFLRLSGGEPNFNLAALIHYPYYSDGVQNFPFKTLAMACGFAAIFVVSAITEKLFAHRIIPEKFDVFQCTSVSKAAILKLEQEMMPTVPTAPPTYVY